MSRAQFTDAEEKLIRDLLDPRHGPLFIWTRYSAWILPSVLLFVFGLLGSQPYPQIVGFVIVLYLLMRFIAYQCRPDWRVIVTKYEEALKKDGQAA